MIKWFKAIQEEDFQLVGGKGANLAKMYQTGLKVPNGFIILSSSYEQYLADNQLKQLISEILEKDISIEEQSSLIQSQFSIDLLSEELRAEIKNGFKWIKSAKVAVRSSSTAEDLPGMSFAGQYSSYLNVTEEDLLEKIILCWQSLWHIRAMDYRDKQGIKEGFSHAVIVQEMVNSYVSGVVFTANPMNGLRGQMVVNASYGLGEAIVSGEVNPDQYVVNRVTGEILDEKIQDKLIQYRYGQEGIEKVQLSKELSKTSSLKETQLKRLVNICDKVENYFGSPQDIEFAIDEEDELYIVQSRDITTLYPIENLIQDGKLRPYMSASTVLLGMREPFTPLGFDLMSQMFPTIINVMTVRKKKPLTNSFVAYAGQRIYIDMSYLLSNRLVAKQFANTFSGNDLPLKGVMLQLIEDYGRQLRKQGIRFKLPLGFIKYGLSIASKMMSINKIPNNQRYEALKHEGDVWFAELLKDYERAESSKERLEFANKALVEAFKLSQVQASYCIDANNYIKIEKVLKKHFGHAYNVETLAQSLPGCFTQTMTVRLNEYAKSCAIKGINPSVDDPDFQVLIKDYGHRANIELDFGTVRWREDPTYLLDLVKSYMVDDMFERNLQDYKDKRQEAEDMIEEVAKKLSCIVGKRRAGKFKTYMINYRYGAAMREYPKSDIVRFIELARKSVQIIGQRLVEEGKLDSQDDVFYLRQDEIQRGANLKGLVRKAKEEYKKEMKRKSIPRMLLNNGHTYYSTSKVRPGTNTLVGSPLSAGVYEGIIKVVYDPLHHTLKEGEIMVTESTNPSWTPLFAIAGALIMEYGGPMSHGGIVAREYGIPAVVGISAAMDVLKDGQHVRINGESGVIELLE